MDFVLISTWPQTGKSHKAHIHTDCKTKTNPPQTLRESTRARINQSSSQADEVYFTLKEWPTLRSKRDHKSPGDKPTGLKLAHVDLSQPDPGYEPTALMVSLCYQLSDSTELLLLT